MSAGRIYLLEENGSLQSLSERPYANEDLLQALLAHYPDLLAGEQMNESEPRRWLLVSREVGVPDEEDVTGRWSLDHLFLDQDGIPTLVEVKRSTDTRIRREVVGQMLDYAANAVVYWPTETVRARFEALCDVQGDDATLLVAELISADPDDDGVIEAFWDHVKTNLRAGRIRLVFVADEIPVQLKRIVEFLNEQMNPAEVLAVEIKQYVGQGIKTLVPKVVGQTAEAQRAKSSGSRAERQWDEPSFFQELEARRGADEARVARQILDWADSTLGQVWWGRGARSGSFVPTLPHKGRNHQLFAVWTYGTVEIYFYWYQSKPPFDSEEKRRELLDRLNAIPGVSLPPDAIGRRPGIPLAVLTDEAALEQLLAVLGWVAEEIQST
jgi:hypothetical protein